MEILPGHADRSTRAELAGILQQAWPAEAGYAPAWSELLQLGAEGLIAGLLAGEEGWWVARDGNRLVGAVHLALPAKGVAQISGLYVLSAARRQGIASRLVAAVLRRAGAAGAEKITAVVAAANPASYFYKAMSFQVAKKAEWPEYVVMERQIGQPAAGCDS